MSGPFNLPRNRPALYIENVLRKTIAAILLVVLIGVPFINWRLGAVLWMCAWLVFIFQKLFARPSWTLEENKDEEEEQEDKKA